MSEGSLFNTLGQILSRGAEIALARALSRGLTYEEARIAVFKRFGPISPVDEISFASFAQSMTDAGIEIGEVTPNQPIPAELIPLNRWLFGDEPSGRRVLAGLELRAEDTGVAREVIEEYPDIPTFEEMEQMALQELERRIGKSPGEFEGIEFERMRRIFFRILYIERRY